MTASDKACFCIYTYHQTAHLQMYNFTDAAYMQDTQCINKHEIKQINERLQLFKVGDMSSDDMSP